MVLKSIVWIAAVAVAAWAVFCGAQSTRPLQSGDGPPVSTSTAGSGDVAPETTPIRSEVPVHRDRRDIESESPATADILDQDLSDWAEPRIRKAELIFDGVLEKTRRHMEESDVPTVRQAVRVAKWQALSLLTKRGRIHYVGPPSEMPQFVNTDDTKYFSTTVDGLRLAYEVTRGEFPEVFGEGLSDRLVRMPTIEELRSEDPGGGVTRLPGSSR